MKGGGMDRRRIMRYTAAGAAFAASSGNLFGAGASPHVRLEEEPDGCITTQTDVLVVGGGTAGTIAAIQAARAGAKTVLVERGAQLGGTTTTGGVSFPGLFDAWGKQVIAGIGWELVKKSVELDGGTLPDFSTIPDKHWKNQVRVNQFLYAILAEEMCADAGVEIAYYEFPNSVRTTGDGWQVDCVGFGTRRRVLCRQIVDCTGGAEVVGMLNLPRLRDGETQPGSMLFKLGEANQPGRPNGPVDPHSALLDSLYVHGADSSSSRTVTAANLAGRKALLAKVRASNERLMHLQPEVSFRESYRIQGETTVTLEDYISGRLFEDALCHAFYPVDLHTQHEVKQKHMAPGTVPTVPRSALIPKRSRNIMVAGRSVSSDRLANSGLRVQASCMAMGQAAGVTAALAAAQRETPLNVPLNDIRELLRQHGAIVPEG